MAGPALRSLTVAGVLALTCVFGGLGGVPATADPGSDSDGSSQDSGGADGGETGDSGEAGDAGDGGEPAPEKPEESGEPDDVAPAEEVKPDVIEPSEPEPDGTGGASEPPREEPPADTQRLAPDPAPIGLTPIDLPFVRVFVPSVIVEIPAAASATIYSTVEIPAQSLEEFLIALNAFPEPAPGPAFRTQQQAPPVADAGTGTTTVGGSGGGGVMSDPVVFRAPLVTVPRAATVAGRSPRSASPAGAPAPGGVTPPGVAGLRTPAIRGSVPTTPGTYARPAATQTAGGQSTQAAAASRGGVNPAEVAAVALPGVAGLLFLTFSGGMIGYRQANSTRYVRTAGAERFLP